MPRVSVIVVTHDSEHVIGRCISALLSQTLPPSNIVIIDSGSSDCEYLKEYSAAGKCEVHFLMNYGFSKSNNIGTFGVVDCSDYILYLNPDAYLFQNFIELAVTFMENCGDNVGCVTGKLLGFDVALGRATGLVDSAGIFRKWYGRWYDRGQGGEAGDNAYSAVEEVPAICGALMFMRAQAVKNVLSKYGMLFDESFFMYKEDIELSIRLRKQGWVLIYNPQLLAYHCRGWIKERSCIPKTLKLMSAENEIRLNVKHRSPYVLWAIAKYLFVRVTGY